MSERPLRGFGGQVEPGGEHDDAGAPHLDDGDRGVLRDGSAVARLGPPLLATDADEPQLVGPGRHGVEDQTLLADEAAGADAPGVPAGGVEAAGERAQGRRRRRARRRRTPPTRGRPARRGRRGRRPRPRRRRTARGRTSRGWSSRPVRRRRLRSATPTARTPGRPRGRGYRRPWPAVAGQSVAVGAHEGRVGDLGAVVGGLERLVALVDPQQRTLGGHADGAAGRRARAARVRRGSR